MTDRLVEWFELALRESMEFYVEDIKYEEGRLEEELEENGCADEEEYIDFLVNQWDDPMEWFIDNFGADEFGRACVVALGYKTWNDFR